MRHVYLLNESIHAKIYRKLLIIHGSSNLNSQNYIVTSTANNIFSAQTYATALEFYIAVSILHEFIHFGENKTQIFLPHEGSLNDAGFQWENAMYGGRVTFDYVIGKITYEKL